MPINLAGYVDGCDVAWRTLKAYSELLPVHPDEGFKGPLPIPLVASIEAEQNESWTGAPIYNELLFDDKYKKANWETTKAGQYPVLTGISKALNNATRGKGKRGVINFNPSKVGYVLRQSLGGLYVVPSDITETALSLMHGETPEPKHLPFVSRFYSPTGELQQQRNTASEYHKNKERWLDWNARTKEIEESGDTAEIRERKASKESKLFDEFEYWRKQIDSARRDKDKAREDSLMYWCNEALRLKEQNEKEL